jgi:hypothetical protein
VKVWFRDLSQAYISPKQLMVTRRVLLTFALLSLLLVGAYPQPTKLIRLTVVNRSGLPLEIGLTGSLINKFNQHTTYYLRLQKNDPRGDEMRVFTIIPDKYSMKVYYVELWDPVYGARCGTASLSVEAYHNTRVLIPVCTISPPNKGEPSMVKLGGRRQCQKFRPVIPQRKPGC